MAQNMFPHAENLKIRRIQPAFSTAETTRSFYKIFEKSRRHMHNGL